MGWLRTVRIGLVSYAFLVLFSCLALPSAWAERDADRQIIEYFSQPGCYYCSQAKEWLEDFRQKNPQLTVVTFNIRENAEALRKLEQISMRQGLDRVAVPAFHVNGQLLVGFSTAEEIEFRVNSLLRSGSERNSVEVNSGTSASCVAAEGEFCSSTSTSFNKDEPLPPPSTIEVPLLGKLSLDTLGLPLFTITLGLVDGFNPCAMWVLLFLLSLLVHLKSRARMLIIAGTFVLVSGIVYFTFMVAWLNFFFLVGITRSIQALLGVAALVVGSIHVKDFLALKQGLSLSIPDSAKPGIYARTRRIIAAESLFGAMTAVVTLAVLVNMVELVCTAGLPVLYTQVLTAQQLPSGKYYLYLVLYNVAYMFDDSLMLLIAIVTLSQAKLQEKGGRLLKLLSGSVMILLGLVMLLKPEWLSFS